MKKSIFSVFLLLAVFTVISISCKSSPPAAVAPEPSIPVSEPEPAPAPTPAPVSADALNEPMNRVEEARKRAMDFDSPSYFPSEWEAVEAQYTDIDSIPKSTGSEIQQAAVLLNTIADTYDELFKKTIPLYAQAIEDEIIAVREELIKTGFTDFFPEYLQSADNIALAAMEQYEAEDYYTSRDTAAAVLKEYETLLIGARVFLTRQEIVVRGFSPYDQENFDKADEVAQTALDKYDAGDKEAARDSAEEALLRYNIVLTNGWVVYASERRTSAVSERDQAVSNRVNVAVRDAFRDADAVFNQAEEDFKNEKYHEAAINFTDAEARFAIAGQETEEKRQRAMETIRLAEEKIEESVETAIEAERIIEGGSR